MMVVIGTVVSWGGVLGWVVSVSRAGDDGIESVVLIGSVIDGTDGAVRFEKLVLTFDYITITGFVLGFVVTSVWVFDSVFELVFWIRLLEQKRCYTVAMALFPGMLT